MSADVVGANFLVDTNDLKRILISQGYINNMTIVNEYVTAAENLNVILSQLWANYNLQSTRNEFLLRIPTTRLQEDQVCGFKKAQGLDNNSNSWIVMSLVQLVSARRTGQDMSPVLDKLIKVLTG